MLARPHRPPPPPGLLPAGDTKCKRNEYRGGKKKKLLEGFKFDAADEHGVGGGGGVGFGVRGKGRAGVFRAMVI